MNGRNCKVLSIWQPWSSLIAIGAKRFETRHWTTHYRGTIAIHAAKLRSKENIKMFFAPPFMEVLQAAGYSTYSALPLGSAVALATLTAIYRAEELYPKLSDQEQWFGNYAPGRFAWRLDEVMKLDAPIPLRGAQGLFEWSLPADVDTAYQQFRERVQ